MFALATEILQNKLKGLVLMTSAPDMHWQKDLESTVSLSPLPEAEIADKLYQENPNNPNLKKCILASASRMFFTKEGLAKGIQFLSQLSYNFEVWQWTEEHFDPHYRAKWIPQIIPTLILSGAKDIAIPIKYFAQNPDYNRSNILMKEIQDAGHFPWIENPQAVNEAFFEYLQMLM